MFSAVEQAASNDQVILALIAIIATSVAALVYVIRTNNYSKTAAEQSTQANRAVNMVSPGEERLVEKVDHLVKSVDKLVDIQEEFSSHGWNTLPADLNNAVNLTTTIRDLQSRDKQVGEKLDILIAELREHVVWEMGAKYGVHGSEPGRDKAPRQP